MLHELRIENLLLLARAELRLAPGLNALTGETGAGKTLLAHALDLLLGGRARPGIVRASASEAYVEGVFSLPAELAPELHDRLPSDCEEIVLARRVWPDGRTRAYVCGRSATVADLRELGGRLLSFYGQHEHRKLMLGSAQLEILDSLAGTGQAELRAQLATAHERVRGLQTRVGELVGLAGARERELDLIRFELDEIETVGPSQSEENELLGERELLRHAETLRLASAGAVHALSPEDDSGGVLSLLAGTATTLNEATGFDSRLEPLAERLEGLRLEAEDLAGELRRYEDTVEATPGRLEEVEERLAALARLSRKHGGAVAEVLAEAERLRARRDELEHADDALAAAQADLAASADELAELAGRLTRRRRAAAKELSRGMRSRLGELAMPDAAFEVQIDPRPDGCGPRGADAVEFLIAPNAGLPAGPLREIASGGELSRVMLALLSVAHGGQATAGEDGDGLRSAAENSLLVFDEIDAGIGGQTARIVGEQLRALSCGRQILCITHLPQVAAVAARHFTIAKDGSVSPALTTVRGLEGEEVVGEIVRMLGAGADDRAAGAHARALLAAA